jgi:hypothetical protein
MASASMRRLGVILAISGPTACTDLGADSSPATGTLSEASSGLSYPTCSRGSLDARRLGLALEVHVENHVIPTADEADYVLEIAREAAEAGVSLTFGLGVDFLRDFDGGVSITTPDHGPLTLAALITTLQDTYCHEVTLHADLPDLDYTPSRLYLQGYATELAAAGGNATVASGACSESAANGGWLRAVRDAGITTLAGAVADCQVTLDRKAFPDYARRAGECTPSSCHEAAPFDGVDPNVDAGQRASGWFAHGVSDWIAPYTPSSPAQARHAVFIVGSFGEANLPCLAEVAAGIPLSECDDTGAHSGDHLPYDDYSTEEEGAADAAILIAEVGQVVDFYRSGTVGDAFHSAFSTNEVATVEWLDGFFGAVADGIDTGTTSGGAMLRDAVTFTTLGAIRHPNAGELGFGL